MTSEEHRQLFCLHPMTGPTLPSALAYHPWMPSRKGGGGRGPHIPFSHLLGPCIPWEFGLIKSSSAQLSVIGDSLGKREGEQSCSPWKSQVGPLDTPYQVVAVASRTTLAPIAEIRHDVSQSQIFPAKCMVRGLGTMEGVAPVCCVESNGCVKRQGQERFHSF